jgi:hypothetical protein
VLDFWPVMARAGALRCVLHLLGMVEEPMAYLRLYPVVAVQDIARNRGRMSLHAFWPIRKPPPCLPYRRLVVPRRLVIGLHRDGLYLGAGDGTRTRDSLLGRQAVVFSPLA